MSCLNTIQIILGYVKAYLLLLKKLRHIVNFVSILLAQGKIEMVEDSSLQFNIFYIRIKIELWNIIENPNNYCLVKACWASMLWWFLMVNMQEAPKKNIHLFGFLEHAFNAFSWLNQKDTSCSSLCTSGYLKQSFN